MSECAWTFLWARYLFFARSNLMPYLGIRFISSSILVCIDVNLVTLFFYQTLCRYSSILFFFFFAPKLENSIFIAFHNIFVNCINKLKIPVQTYGQFSRFLLNYYCYPKNIQKKSQNRIQTILRNLFQSISIIS